MAVLVRLALLLCLLPSVIGVGKQPAGKVDDAPFLDQLIEQLCLGKNSCKKVTELARASLKPVTEGWKQVAGITSGKILKEHYKVGQLGNHGESCCLSCMSFRFLLLSPGRYVIRTVSMLHSSRTRCSPRCIRRLLMYLNVCSRAVPVIFASTGIV